MATRLEEPHSDDVLIEHKSNGHFVIGSCASAPQIECVNFEEALQRAGRFAAAEHVDLWYLGGDGARRHFPDACSLRTLWNEFIDLPGLHLTFEQVRRFMAVDATTCASVLESLVELQFLKRAADRSYVRSSDRHESVGPLGMNKA